ncbi:shikimate kinase [Fumia xinanensis]|uniref:Shikimate kinase n=1 Tax=Fumia xinanensis TaxID=2763659 RepID=A0A926E797_9FIRM|nr:shikimate kinase [Fumia xinanensis]MBC8560898.1 shikimate kinase [Fumia xinanensis]
MKNNIVLIGMPGSGKSTVGKILAEKTGLFFVDLDAVIENMAKKSIPQIFSEDGEPAFRDLEQKCVEEVSAQSRQVIATGGGVILREANMKALSQNGLIIFLDRPVSDILGENLSERPLLADDATRIHRLYDERIRLYRRYGKFTVENNSAPEEAAEKILDAIREVTK